MTTQFAALDKQFLDTVLQIRGVLYRVDALRRKTLEKWITKLQEPQSCPEWKRNRNAYALYLLDQVSRDKLGEPFTRRPPEQHLPTLPAHIRSYYLRVGSEQIASEAAALRRRATAATGFTGEVGPESQFASRPLTPGPSNTSQSAARRERARRYRSVMATPARLDSSITDATAKSVRKLIDKIYSETPSIAGRSSSGHSRRLAPDSGSTVQSAVPASLAPVAPRYGAGAHGSFVTESSIDADAFGGSGSPGSGVNSSARSSHLSRVSSQLQAREAVARSLAQQSTGPGRSQLGASRMGASRTGATFSSAVVAGADRLAARVDELQRQLADSQARCVELEATLASKSAECERLRSLVAELTGRDEGFMQELRQIHSATLELAEGALDALLASGGPPPSAGTAAGEPAAGSPTSPNGQGEAAPTARDSGSPETA